DYTPALFYNKGITTYTHQLALLYLFNSSLQCLAENPINLLADERFKPVIPYLQELPVVWDETIVLEGSAIGDLAIFARRKGTQWYVVAINGTNSDKKVLLKPSFLKVGAKYEATLIADTKDQKGFLKEEFIMWREGQKSIIMKPNGGVVINIKQKHE
ncbi:MAG: glycoside hydrolase family 97 C-terminal domain-containing protein, partial [Sphingobacterium sp.]